ncbi:hypothetical protein [Calothrix sp. PCC 7507]|uniref:hypothetical protein n=1 Tax=Calothrix sp. PCC 7507 TaxID=99598 RepID=UPI000317DEF5|nr:hypothetical protein [Calothrix sp. PCC 7507]
MLGDSYGKLTRSRFCSLVLENWYHRCDRVISLVMLDSDRFYSMTWLRNAITWKIWVKLEVRLARFCDMRSLYGMV